MGWVRSPNGRVWGSVVALTTLAGCGPADDSGAPRPEAEFRLAWYPADETETWDDVEVGLDWAWSQMGALPPPGTANGTRTSVDGVVTFPVALDDLALPPSAREVVDTVVAELSPAGEPVDIGRFLMRSLHEPARYAAMTGACPTRGEWAAARQAADPLLYAVTTSLLTSEDRRVALNAGPTVVGAIGYLAESGEGSLADGTFTPREAEVVDVMPNGQFRYAVYGEDGALLPAGEHAPTGTPGKCAWCHEDHIQAGSDANASAEGYIDHATWTSERVAAQAVLDSYRASLATSIDFSPPVHEAAERLVEGFLFPDDRRVALEWGVSEAAVRILLGGGTADQEEFGWTGRHRRADVDAAAAAGEVVRTLPSARELADDAVLADAPPPRCE